MFNRCKLDGDNKGVVYSDRVLIGNWYESAKLEEYKLNRFLTMMKKGDLLLAKYRKMTENLNRVTTLTQSTNYTNFGAKIALVAPYVSVSDTATDTSNKDNRLLFLGGRISSTEINYHQDLEVGCALIGIPSKVAMERNTFIITSADYCDRTNETLKYNQEFLLAVSSSVEKKRPLYVRYDTDSFPGLNGLFPLYLSDHAVSNTRWRILPKQRPDITRFEQEGEPVPVNTDIVINHCATNCNLGLNAGRWTTGFYGKICAPIVKTCLDVFGRELPHNLWKIHIPFPE